MTKKLKSTIIDKETFFQEKITSAYEDRLFKDYQQHGEQAFETLRKENPEMYVLIAAWLLGNDFVLAHMKALNPNLTEV
jgi:hypothetical protein